MSERVYDTKVLPADIDLSRFAPPYIYETFSQKDKELLTPFFSNTDNPIFVVKNLPIEIQAALASRYSRSVESMRRVFLNEYIYPVIEPEKQKGWEDLTKAEKVEAGELKNLFLNTIEFLNKSGGLEKITNVQRARKFFDKWLAQYGDDSIGEMGGVLVGIEGISGLALEEVVNKRIGMPLIVKSSRYVSFSSSRPIDGKFQYYVPGEIKGTDLETEYVSLMNEVFIAYKSLEVDYLNYIKEMYPKEEDETDSSFERSRGAKRYDDVRDLLPFATQTGLGLVGNGRAYEMLMNRLLFHPIGEMRWLGQALMRELAVVVPSLVSRAGTERGAEIQYYRRNINESRSELASKYLISSQKRQKTKKGEWATLVHHDKDADVQIIATYLFPEAEDCSLQEVYQQVQKWSKNKRNKILAKILVERKFGKDESIRESDRFKTVPRAFENADYLFNLRGRAGDYRDLHRHRMNTEEHKPFTVDYGYNLEEEVLASPYKSDFEKILIKTVAFHKKLAEEVSVEVAQYVVSYAFIQDWYMNLSAREIYWMCELRTGPQGRPHYREICQQIAQLATQATPSVFQGLMVDWNKYGLSRRESEKKIERRLNKLGVSRE